MKQDLAAIATTFRLSLLAFLGSCLSPSASAGDWNQTSLGYRYGEHFAEPFNAHPIRKNIFNLSYASGDAYGGNYFNADWLISDHNDPRSPVGSDPAAARGAQEVYVVYRRLFDFGKISGQSLSWGPIRGLGATVGFDINDKDDAAYNSKKRMLIAGPTLILDVPGFMNVSLLALKESNAPYNEYTNTATPRYHYDTHPMLSLAWGIPLRGSKLSFEGYANFIAAKGKNEFGGDTAAETNIDLQLMYDASAWLSSKPNTFRVGPRYQFWKNKFGNDHQGPAGNGAYARTPMLYVDYRF